MLFEDSREMALKEIPVTFRCDEKFRDYIYREAGALDIPVSEMIRAAVLLALPQMKNIHGIARIQLEDMRCDDKSQ